MNVGGYSKTNNEDIFEAFLEYFDSYHMYVVAYYI